MKLLEMVGITKHFVGVLANDNINFDLNQCEIHTLLGENGAGKSTLMKILYGLYNPDEGEIRLRGETIEIKSPSDAIRHGIGMVHQHFMLVPTLTVAENVSLGLRSSRHPLTDLPAVSKRITELSELYSLKVDPDTYIWQLAMGERQRVEILKALYRNASVLVLDEPTAALTPQEVAELIHVLKKMAADGRGIIFISHKLKEVMAVSDRITVLRDGQVTGEITPAQTNESQLAQMMVGRPVQLVPDRPKIKLGEPRLVIQDLYVDGDRGDRAVVGVSLEVREGEILGLAGVSGNGQRELAQAIAGMRNVVSGTVKVGGKDTTNKHPKVVRQARLSYVPEERLYEGTIPSFAVSDNLILLDRRDKRFCQYNFMHFTNIKEHCLNLVRRFLIKTPTLETTTSDLSGGNIQKLIMARELSGRPKVLLASQPTIGIDVGATEYIYSQLLEQKADGCAILLISEDLDELMVLADRIAVIYEGQIMDILDHQEADLEQLGLLMAGVKENVPWLHRQMAQPLSMA